MADEYKGTSKVSPQDTVYINPGVGELVSDYTGYSRGTDAPRGQQFSEGRNQALRGLGELWTSVVQGTNNVIEKRLSEEIRDFSNNTNDVMLNTDIPDGLKRSAKEAAGLKAAFEAGTISERSYWQRMEAKARSLKQRYSGHQEWIDREFSSNTGGIPANKLREMNFNAASSGDDAAKFAAANGQYLTDEQRASIGRGVIPPLNEMIYTASTKRAAVESNNAVKAELEAKDKTIEYKSKVAQQSLGEQYDRNMSKLAPGFKDMQANIKVFMTDGVLSDQEKEKLYPIVMQAKMELEQSFRAEAIGMGESKINYAMYMSDEQINQKMKPYLDAINGMSEAVLGKNPSAINMWGNFLTSMTDRASVNVLNQNEYMKRLSVTTKLLSPEVVAGSAYVDLTTGNGGTAKAMQTGKRSIGEYLTGGVLAPPNPGKDTTKAKPETLTKGITNLQENMDGETTKYSLSHVTSAFTTLKDPNEIANAASNIFDDPVGFIENFNAANYGPDGPKIDARTAAFQYVTTPQVAAQMYKIRDTHPEVYDKYRKYVVEGSEMLSSRAILDLQNTIVSGSYEGFNVRYDDKHHRFIPILDNLPPGIRKSFGKSLETKVETFNQAVAPLINMWTAEGGDPKATRQLILEHLKTLGFDPTQPRQPGLASTVGDLIKQGYKNLMDGPWKLGANMDPGQSVVTTTMAPRSYYENDDVSRVNREPGYISDLGPDRTELQGATQEFKELFEAFKKDKTPDNEMRAEEAYRNLIDVRTRMGLPVPDAKGNMTPTSGGSGPGPFGGRRPPR
jgi:hypothetical protein